MTEAPTGWVGASVICVSAFADDSSPATYFDSARSRHCRRLPTNSVLSASVA